MVERNLAKVEVASSSLVSRSKHQGEVLHFPLLMFRVHSSEHTSGEVAEWLCSGLQLRVRRFDSDPRLHQYAVARVVELVDTADLKSAAYLNKGRTGSIPVPGTIEHTQFPIKSGVL